MDSQSVAPVASPGGVGGGVGACVDNSAEVAMFDIAAGYLSEEQHGPPDADPPMLYSPAPPGPPGPSPYQSGLDYMFRQAISGFAAGSIAASPPRG